MISRRKLIATGLGVTAGLVTAGCSQKSPSSAAWSQPGPAAANAPAPKVRVTVTPAADATKVSPLEHVVVAAEGGTIKGVSVATGGKSVAGKLGDDQIWRSTGKLAYGKTYTVTVTAADSAGTVTEHRCTFSTVKPSGVAGVTFQANALTALRAGGTYGVGQPVMVNFSKPVKNRAEAEKAMLVQTTPAVEGRWRWIDSRNAHWRPAKYWTPGTKISVKVNLFGQNLGQGVYGGSNASTDFTIGPSRIAIADARTHRMKVYIDGKVVRDIPISMGKGGTTTGANGETVSYWTRSGPHVVMTREPSHRMTSASYGVTDPKDPNYYDEVIQLCLRISYSGEFVHMADWNIGAQGNQNTSHGCINVGPAHARWFYDTFRLGDVVDVRNTPRAMTLTDGVGDWTIPWDKW
ncbi:Ig-like domain-containing protein [Micromonospora sp. DR5-3]|uniref:L,D-transpeptidase n=1 Tax=unclassified Micromonospora TaxID=2617518 RepID=UPI0011D69E40|nr:MULTISPECIES: Ig-like domain-containing protein [unclassified Micromonospora]MCW3814014.1 Ig-like domain-containing protein [Micromonospora sp. DR5-3]TYC23630.1 L,D-transpeptidase family protein [Micromonospora sp. MP36]